MKFSKKRFFIISSLLLATTFNASCSAFFGEEGYVITDVSQNQNENGDTVLTLTFSDTEKKPLVITIPKGVSGKDGVGILSITPTLIGGRVKITIKFTDPKIEDTIIEVPVVQGKDGKGISEVVVGSDEIGNTTIQFKYTDGTIGDLITVPKGIDGNGIQSISPLKRDESALTTTYEITFTNGTKSTFDVKDGRDGVSIQSIAFDEVNSTETEYALNVTYSNSYVETIMLTKPKANTWLNGMDVPDSLLGTNGDFYLNIVNGDVYLKENGGWSFRFSIKAKETTKIESGVVIFNYTDETGAKQMKPVPGIIGKTIDIEKIPVLAQANKTFLGWYSTTQNDNFSVNAGKFTNLTPLTAEVMNVYAWRN